MCESILGFLCQEKWRKKHKQIHTCNIFFTLVALAAHFSTSLFVLFSSDKHPKWTYHWKITALSDFFNQQECKCNKNNFSHSRARKPQFDNRSARPAPPSTPVALRPCSHFCLSTCAYLTPRPAGISRTHCSYWHGLAALTRSSVAHS